MDRDDPKWKLNDQKIFVLLKSKVSIKYLLTFFLYFSVTMLYIP